jgi:uncharacterized protein YciI
MTWYLYKLIPPRPDFASTMSATEREAMKAHVGYWSGHMNAGQVMIFTPVADPAGDWGMAVVNAESIDDARSLGDTDPAVLAGVARYEVFELPGASVPA